MCVTFQRLFEMVLVLFIEVCCLVTGSCTCWFSGLCVLLLIITTIIIASDVLEHKWRASLKLHYC